MRWLGALVLALVCVTGLPVARAEAPWLGITMGDGALGVSIREVHEDTGAADAGLRAGDEIVRIDDRPIGSRGDLVTAIVQRTVGTTITLLVVRDGALMRTTATLTARVSAGDLLARRWVGLPAAGPVRGLALSRAPTVVALFDPRCAWCEASAEAIARGLSTVPGARLRAALVAEDEPAQAYLKRARVGLPLAVLDPADVEAALGEGWLTDGLVLFVVDGQGRVRLANVWGEPDDAAVDEVVTCARRAVRRTR